MFLSKLTLDPRQMQVRRDIGDAYEMHRTLARAFVSDCESPPVKFLWRVETDFSASSAPAVLIQSASPANWAPIEALPGYLQTLQANKQVDLEAFVRVGERYRFRLRANPTVTRAGKRLGLVKQTEQLAWIERQADRAGLGLLSCVRTGSDRINVRQDRTGRLISVHAASFEGVINIIDSNAVRRALIEGIGHGKAFGLGLLSLARLSPDQR